ncbi:MAG: VOC family protein [Chryseolinea sp.]
MKSNHNKNDPMETVSSIPDGYHTVTPYLVVSDVKGLLDFIEKGLDGKTVSAMKADDGSIIHATVRIGDSMIMAGSKMDDNREAPAMLYLYVDDVDALYSKATKVKGTKMTRELKDEFYGDRAGCVTDAWGNQWWIATHMEDVSEDELKRRSDANRK